MEDAGEVEESDFLRKPPRMQNTPEEATWALEAVEPKPAKKANIIPVSMMVALERKVMENGAPAYACEGLCLVQAGQALGRLSRQ